jgi:two-component system alkaline phosphatase synthesis response regulator PhoP
MARKPIVIVEDDDVIAELIDYNLQAEGFTTRRYTDAKALNGELSALESSGVALFVLDIMLPGMDGFEICAALRKNNTFDLTPILMLTARAAEHDKVRGLETGADDYLTKPFGIREFLSRVRSLIRRYGKIALARGQSEDNLEKSEDEAVLTAGPLRLDDRRRRVFSGDDEVQMTNREYELLKFLLKNKGIAFTRDELLNHVWGYEYAGETRTVDVHIRQLRRKLGADDRAADLIETIRGHGYRFSDAPAET